MFVRMTLAVALMSWGAAAEETLAGRMTAGHTAAQQGRYKAAQTEFEAALRLAPGGNGTAEALEALSDLNFVQGDYRAAEGQMRQVVTLREKALGEAVTGLTPYLVKWAGMLRAEGKPEEAETLLKRALTIHEARDPWAAPIAGDLDQLAALYQQMKRGKDAMDALQRAYAIRMRANGPDSAEAIQTLVALGQLYVDLGRYVEAESAFKNALASSETTLGAESYALIGLLDRLGLLYRQQNRFLEAEPYFQRGLAIRERNLGPFHSEVAPALDSLALCYYREEKFQEAEGLYKRSLAIWEATQGKDSAFAAIALDNLGALYATERQFDRAEPLFLRALGIREGHMMQNLDTLAGVNGETGKLDRAELFYRRALMLGEKGLGGDHAEVAPVMRGYAALLRKQKRTAEAARLEGRAKQIEGQATVTEVPR